MQWEVCCDLSTFLSHSLPSTKTCILCIWKFLSHCSLSIFMLETPQSPPHPAACLQHSSAPSSKRSSALGKYIAILHWKTQHSKLQQFLAEGLPWPENTFHIYCLTTDFFSSWTCPVVRMKEQQNSTIVCSCSNAIFPFAASWRARSPKPAECSMHRSPFTAWVIITSPFYAFPAQSRLSFSSDNNQNCTRCARNQ